jgi:hypothetical protein
MSPRHLRLIALGLAVVLLLWGSSELLSRGSGRVTDRLALPALVQSQIDTIASLRGTDSLVFARRAGDAWTINGHPAAPDAARELFNAVADTALTELVAQDPSSFARLGVDSVTGRRLQFRGGRGAGGGRAGKPLLELVVGRGADFATAYVRRPGETRVYLWTGRLAQLLDRSADEWRDKRIAAVEPDSITGVVVERGKDRWTLTRDGHAWKLDGVAADSGAVARTLEKYRVITAAGFATPAQADSARRLRAARPARRLTLRGARGTTLLSLAFDSIPGAFWVRRVGGTAAAGEPGTLYRMNSWDADGLTPASHSLGPPPTK